MMGANLKKATELAAEIDRIERFIEIMNRKQYTTGGGVKSLGAIINIKTTTSVNVIGNFGSRTIKIEVPDSVLPDLVVMAQNRLSNLQKEYNALWATKPKYKE